MLGNAMPRILLALACSAALLISFPGTPVAAQTNTAAILGTVTDASGGTIPGAKVTITNTGTAATQVTTTGADGRYRVPALPIGEYDVRVEAQGFQVVDHKGITLIIGSEQVVDFSLTVGQVTQTVTVEGDVSAVETTSSEVSTLVSPTQMRELPLNGRDFEQLVLLAPGVTITQNIGNNPAQGFGAAYSVGGSRVRGQAEILDDNDIVNWMGRNAGAGVLGTSLGVDAVAEFKLLTSTYSAQYGGNGSALTSVTKSGSNSLHGSVYEFIRNSALDARNFFDPPQIPEFQKNQFGGTLGGPIKKDKMFFFTNYEGVRQLSNPPYGFNLPDNNARNGFVNGSCVPNPALPFGTPGTANAAACFAALPAAIKQFMPYFPDPTAFPHGVDNPVTGIQSSSIPMRSPAHENYIVGRYDWTISSKDSMFARYVLDYGFLFDVSSPVPSTLAPTGWSTNDTDHDQFLSVEEKRVWSNNVISSTRAGFSRTGIFVEVPASENYDPALWNFENSPTYGFPTFNQGAIAIASLTNANFPRSILGGQNGNNRIIQNKFTGGEDIYWNKGAHAVRFGGSITRMQSYYFTPPLAGQSGQWAFSNITTFLQNSPRSYNGACISTIPACAAAGFTSTPVAPHEFLESDFAFYIQDDWKLSSTLTLNLGLRYSPTTNPRDAFNSASTVLNLPFAANYDPSMPMPGCNTAIGNPITPTTPNSIACPPLPAGVTGYTAVSRVYQKNPSLHTFDPRVGIAWDPFRDHKTSVRAGYGIFHYPLLPFDYTRSFPNTAPGTAITQTCTPTVPCSTFPTPFQALGAAPIPTLDPGVDSSNHTTAYMEQYNLAVQHELFRRTTLTVAYVGSSGVKLPGEIDENPSLPSGVPGAVTVPAGSTIYPYVGPGISTQMPCSTGLTAVAGPGAATGCVNNTSGSVFLTSASGQAVFDTSNFNNTYANIVCTRAGACSVTPNNRVDPAIGFWNEVRAAGFWSHYNSLQISLNRQSAAGLQTQISYTYGSCITNSSGTGPADDQIVNFDPYDPNRDSGPCAFQIRNNFYATGIYVLPFHKTRLVGGWQVGGIFQVHSGGLITAGTGWSSGFTDRASTVTNNRPDVVANCKQVLGQVNAWLNSSCYTMPPIGEVGNVGPMSVVGPNSMTLDTSLVKNTKISERFNLQIRAEAFNILNRTNFRNPGQPITPIFQAATPTPACEVTPISCSTLNPAVNQLNATNASARQIQLGAKLIF